MSRVLRHSLHDKYKTKLAYLFKVYDRVEDPEEQAHKAKYLAVLVSGYLEQAIKELLLNYSSKGSRAQIAKYVEKTWPKSMGMKVENILNILDQFDSSWSKDFESWLDGDIQRKVRINSLVAWRNMIAHGQEANTTNVTLNSVKTAFSTATDLVALIENKVGYQTN